MATLNFSIFLLLVFSFVLIIGTPVKYPHEIFPEGNTTVFSVQHLSYGGKFITGLGKDGQLYELHQNLQQDGSLQWTTQWNQLTKYCPSANDSQRICVFDSDPVVARNTDGRLEIFVRFHGNLDLWQMYMTDAKDPSSWTVPREPSCVDQDQKTGIWWCLCPKINAKQSCTYPTPNYWNRQPIFPTSDVSVSLNQTDGRLQIYFRGFAGFFWYFCNFLCESY